MPDPLDFDNRPLAERLGRARLRTFLSLLLERLTENSWRLLTWAGLFGGLWLFNVPLLFGNTGGVLTLAVFVLGVFFFLYRDFFRLSLPSRPDIDRRIESESAVKHRPLSALGDNLANPQKLQTRQLWESARERLVEILKQLRAAKTRPFMAARDPYALRLGVVLFFLVGIYTAGPAWDERLVQGLVPLRLAPGTDSTDKLALWITPPEYTGLAPIVIKGKGDGTPIEIPAGSALKISVRGGPGLPHLIKKEERLAFTRTEDGNYILDAPLPEGDTLKVRQGLFTRAAWPYRIIPDVPPQITPKDSVEITTDGTMRFPFEVQDDYGVKTLTMDVTLNQSMPPDALGDPVKESRAVMSPPNIALPVQPVYDLTSHPWAGQPVAITFTVEDGLGQKTSAPPVTMALPERQFMHPVAKNIIALRKRLILKPENQYLEIANALEHIMIRPGQYLDDKVVFLALRAAASRLMWADPPTREHAAAVASLLWDTALRIEGGEISIAARNLRDAQRNLEEALENPDVKPEEIQKLMSELRAAMAEYFMELQREMQKRMAEGQQFPMVPPDMMAQALDPETLNNFLEQLEAKMMAGDTKGAQEMMGQLQRFFDMMDPSMTAPMPEDMQMMSEGINELQEIVKRQRQLLEQTQSQVKSLDALAGLERHFGDSLLDSENLPKDWDMGDMPPPPDTPKEPPAYILNTSPHKTEQEALRHTLGQLMLKAGEALNEVPENMGLAEQEMRGSSAALGANDPGGSVPHQQKTLEHLEEAQKQLSQQLMARLQQMTGMSMMGGGMKFDPLGRPYGGDGKGMGFFGSPVKIPDEATQKKAQEILRLLRRRSSELGRPEEELEYYKRLLRQF